MPKFLRGAVAWLAAGLFTGVLLPQHAVAIDLEFLSGQMPNADKSVTAYGEDMFGDKLSMFDGSLQFEHTDLQLKGNNDLPVALIRGFSIGKHDAVGGYTFPLANWTWKVPRLGGSFAKARGWLGGDGSTARCSKFWRPRDESGHVPNPSALVTFFWSDFWHGTNIEIPGQVSQEVQSRNPAYASAPTSGGPFPLVTKQQWQIGCLASVQNGTGEGFYAISPSGVRYDFDWYGARTTDALKKGRLGLQRLDIFLYASKVTDRFGNWVKYTYDSASPTMLQRIEASDGRLITVTNSGGLARSATDGTRTVSYAFSTSSRFPTLSTVTHADGSQWKFDISSLHPPNLLVANRPTDACDDGSTLPNGPSSFSGSIVHPSGAVATFEMRYAILYRMDIQAFCNISGGAAVYDTMPAHVSLALSSKQISGPGLPTMTWAFDLQDISDHLPSCATSSCTYRVNKVTGPDGNVARHFYGNTWRVNEGLHLADQLGWDGTTAAQTTVYTYHTNIGQVYPQQFGNSFIEEGDWFAARLNPIDSVTVYQQGQTFAKTVNQFDATGRAIQVARSGPGGGRTETTTYYDNPSLWVLGSLQAVVSGGQTMQSNGFNAMAQLESHSEFGVLKYMRSYNTDGTLASEADALGHTTYLSNFMRGVPQNVSYPTGAAESAGVNNLGLFTSYTNAVGDTTSYGYDAMGRLASITPPTGWATTSLTFEPVSTIEYDLPADHWRLTVSQGNARTISYFDAMWRPVMMRSYDLNDEANTRKVVVKAYDPHGKVTFESYPQRDFSTVAVTSPGRRNTYDALGRLTQTRADSELGVLTSTTEYLTGFLTRNTNPRGKQATQGFWALGNPDEAQLASLSVPAGTGLSAGMNLSITRDAYGKPLSITRGDSSASVTRRYIYDANQRLCKTLEPEVIATVQDYDGAGNLAWRAPGVNLPGSANCDQASVAAGAKISYAYNQLNMLTGTSYGDGSPSVSRDYWADGKLKTVSTSDGSNWSYGYNSLRLLATETLTMGSQSYALSWSYDTLGHLSSLTYPSGGPTITYSPNALGEARSVGGYASGVSYWPNGAVAGYTLASGIVHSLTQNTRGLPLVNRDAGVMQDQYSYDANGNVTGIADLQENVFNRAMSYDDLDRLATGNAPGAWGNASYSYDAVDNLRSASVGSRISTLAYDASNRLSSMLTNGNTTSYGYDARGNISSKGGQRFWFDIGNRLSGSSLGGSFHYDGHGRRTQVTETDGATRVQVYSAGGQLLWAAQPVAATSVPAMLTGYTCSTGALSGAQCVSTGSYAATPASYGCNAGDVLNGTNCSHTTSSSYAATVTSYSCGSGDTLSGATCTHTSNATYTAAIASYSCSAGDTLSGTSCTHIATSTYAAAIASYSCNSGDALSGSSCTHTSSSSYAATPASYSCNAGDSLVGTTCTHTTSTAATPLYGCPANYTLNATTCSRATNTSATPSYGCNGLGSPALSAGIYTCTGQTSPTPDESYDQKCDETFSGYGLAYLSGIKQGTKLLCAYQAQVNYSCPGGGTVSGSQCVSTVTQSATISSYNCSSGTVSGSSCVTTNSYAASVASYSCTAGDALNGSTCTHTASNTYGATVASYSCNAGDALSGSTCTHSVSSSYVATPASYSCNVGDTLSGNTCTHTSGSSYAASPASYSCNAGDALSGGTCTHNAASSYAASVKAYNCNAGDTLSGSICTHTSAVAATPIYNCSSGTLSGMNCLGSTTASSTAYVYLGTKQIAEWNSVSGTQFVHTDALGSPVAHSNAAGTLMNRSRFEPYGYVAAGTKPGTNTSVIGFTGHVQDQRTDLVYMQQRYYDPIAGRFLSVDPVVTDANTGKGFGLYTYVDNNPYSKIDPDGRAAIDWVHGALTAASFAPSFVGSAASAIDGVVHLAQGNKTDAGISFAAAAVGIVSDAGAAKLTMMGVKEASSAVQAVKLEKALASEAQTAKVMTGAGEKIAGAGTKTELRDAPRLAAEHGGNAKDWSKVSGGSHVAKDGTKIETHAYQNGKTVVEPKTKLIDEGK